MNTLFILIIVAIVLFWIKRYLSSSFWIYQPVCFKYCLNFLFREQVALNRIIRHTMPKKNKFVDYKNIHCCMWKNLEEHDKLQILQFIRKHYMTYGDNRYFPKLDNIVPYFTGNDFVSIYVNKNNKKCAGLITTRKINVFFNDKQFNAWYVDFLCVHTKHRNKGIAQKLIQSHEYSQCYNLGKSVISLFKKEDALTRLLVPLCEYSAIFYKIDNFLSENKNDFDLQERFSTSLKKNDEIIDYLYPSNLSSKWKILIQMDKDVLLDLISTKNIIIGGLWNSKTLVAIYIFRKTCTFIKKDEEVVSCIASSKISPSLTNYSFYKGFCDLIKKLQLFSMVGLEQISDNTHIIHHINDKYLVAIKCQMAYYFYNFSYEQHKSDNVFILL